jgi:hypothetical protein
VNDARVLVGHNDQIKSIITTLGIFKNRFFKKKPKSKKCMEKKKLGPF